MLDLSSLTPSEAPVPVEIMHPINRTPLGIRIFVHGSDSDKFNQALIKRQDRRMRAARNVPGSRAVTAAELEEDAVTLLADCTARWEQYDPRTPDAAVKHTLTDDGKELESTPVNVALMYRKYAWMREQVDASVNDRSNFLKTSS